MFAESQEGEDGMSISSGIDNEEESAPSATSKGAAALTTTMRRKGLSTPPATPGTTRGGCIAVAWPNDHVTATLLTASMLCNVSLHSFAVAFEAPSLLAIQDQKVIAVGMFCVQPLCIKSLSIFWALTPCPSKYTPPPPCLPNRLRCAVRLHLSELANSKKILLSQV